MSDEGENLDVSGQGEPSGDSPGGLFSQEDVAEMAKGLEAGTTQGEEGPKDQPPKPTGVQPPPTDDPFSKPLPEGHPLAGKYKTFGDLAKGYESSAAEMQHVLGYVEKARSYIKRLEAAVATKGQTQPGPKSGFNADEMNRLYKENPQRGIAYLFENAPPEVVEKLLQPHLEKHLKPFQEREEQASQREFQDHLNRQALDLEKEYPEAKPGTPEWETTQKWIESHDKLCKGLRDDYRKGLLGDINLPELLFLAANAKNLRATAKGMESRLDQTRKNAGTARSSAGSGKAKKASSWEEQGAEIEAKARDFGLDADNLAETFQNLKI